MIQRKNLIINLFTLLIFICSCTNNGKNKTGISTDQEGNNFKTIKIGKQVWMAQNLIVSTFKNGDYIEEAKSDLEWYQANKNRRPAWCYFDNNPKTGKKYGKLYNWHAVNDPRGLAPEGWHIPSQNEWKVLEEYLGGSFIAGTRMKSQNGWNSSGHGTNVSGFNALPCGDRPHEAKYSRYKIGDGAFWWSSTRHPKTPSQACTRWVTTVDGDLNFNWTNIGNGCSIRCIKN